MREPWDVVGKKVIAKYNELIENPEKHIGAWKRNYGSMDKCLCCVNTVSEGHGVKESTVICENCPLRLMSDDVGSPCVEDTYAVFSDSLRVGGIFDIVETAIERRDAIIIAFKKAGYDLEGEDSMKDETKNVLKFKNVSSKGFLTELCKQGYLVSANNGEVERHTGIVFLDGELCGLEKGIKEDYDGDWGLEGNTFFATKDFDVKTKTTLELSNGCEVRIDSDGNLDCSDIKYVDSIDFGKLIAFLQAHKGE